MKINLRLVCSVIMFGILRCENDIFLLVGNQLCKNGIISTQLVMHS